MCPTIHRWSRATSLHAGEILPATEPGLRLMFYGCAGDALVTTAHTGQSGEALLLLVLPSRRRLADTPRLQSGRTPGNHPRITPLLARTAIGFFIKMVIFRAFAWHADPRLVYDTGCGPDRGRAFLGSSNLVM